jgi:Zn-dependent protease
MRADELVINLAVIAMVLLVAFPLHEFAHALTAFRLGDGTARLLGRLTLDPRVHFDPLGGLLLAITVLLPGGFFIGWAKPTPYNPMNLRGAQWGEAAVAAAGPISNLVMAAAAALPLRYILASGMDVQGLAIGLDLFVRINLFLMVFNFLPIPPLDGSKVLYAFLDPKTAWQVRPFLEQYGLVFLFLLAFLPSFGGPNIIGGILTTIIGPVYNLLVGLPL